MKLKITLWDRLLHAVLFEMIALAICTPVMSWVMNRSLLDAGILVLAVALTAMVWNMVYNALFDNFQARVGFSKTPIIRIFHALGYEAGLIIAVVLLASWWFSISYWEAFLLEIGLILFFLPYTYLFNLVYDKVQDKRYSLNSIKC